jgi:hypothetical protein
MSHIFLNLLTFCQFAKGRFSKSIGELKSRAETLALRPRQDLGLGYQRRALQQGSFLWPLGGNGILGILHALDHSSRGGSDGLRTVRRKRMHEGDRAGW